MKTFTYRGFDLSGQLSRGLIEALDLKEARERLSARGILPEAVSEAGTDRPIAAFRIRPPSMGAGARASFYRELGALLRAGVPMVPALQIAINAADTPDESILLARVRDRVREGSGLTDALATTHDKIPAFERAALVAGERAGTLDIVLERLADHLNEQQKIQERLGSALIYPAFVVVLAIVIGIGLLGFALPNLAKLFADSRIQLPFLTRALLSLGQNATTILPVLLIMAGGLIFLVVRSLRADVSRRAQFHRALFRWPLVGKNLRLLVNARFAQTFSLLLKGGVGVVEAMELSGAATGNVWLTQLLMAEANEVRHGKTLSNAIKSVPPFSHSLAGWMEAGEASGSLPDLLDRAGNRFQQQWSQHLTRCLNVLEPMLIVVVGVFVLLVALAVLLPILSLNRTLM